MTTSQIRTITVFVSDQERAKSWGLQATFADPDGNGFVLAAR